MPIHYRCPSCDQLLSITTRKAGHEVPCPQCGSSTIVPPTDASIELFTAPGMLVDDDSALDPLEPPAPSDLDDESELAAISDEAPADPDVHEAAIPEVPGRPELDPMEADVGGFQLRRSSPELGELDLTSMVDVTFLLLIFFMVTASFSLQKTIEIPAPKQDQKGAAQSLTIEDLQANTIFVKIDERNGIFVDDVPAGDPSKLTEILTQSRLTTLRTEVAIDAHPDSLHETTVLVIDAATAAGMQKIRIISRTGASE